MKRTTMLLALLGSLLGSAQAAVIYDESVSGDLATFSTTTLHFSNGSNTLLGSGTFSTGTDFDGFLFQISVGQILHSATFRILSSSIAGDTTSLIASYALYAGSHRNGSSLFSTNLDLLSTVPVTVNDSAPFLAPGIYAVSPMSLSRNGSGGTWNYEVTFNVTDNNVPEPASLALMGLGLAGLAAGRRRQR